jgi:hypothetical protein
LNEPNYINQTNQTDRTDQTDETDRLKLWVLNDEGGRVGARKVAEPAAEGANVTVGSWQAPQEFEGIFFVQPNKQDKPNKRIRLTGQAGADATGGAETNRDYAMPKN